MKNHIKIKHAEQILTCNQCKKKFTTLSYLNAHITEKNLVEPEVLSDENQYDTSFVFSESMLDEFVDQNIVLQV